MRARSHIVVRPLDGLAAHSGATLSGGKSEMLADSCAVASDAALATASAAVNPIDEIVETNEGRRAFDVITCERHFGDVADARRQMRPTRSLPAIQDRIYWQHWYDTRIPMNWEVATEV